MSIGKRIREAREARDLTQHDLALAAGVRDAQVSRWERGVAVPRWPSMKRIADLMGISVEELMDETEAA